MILINQQFKHTMGSFGWILLNNLADTTILTEQSHVLFKKIEALNSL